MQLDVAIVGAGISGLAAAHFLTQHGLRVAVWERESRAGGVIGTVQRNGFLAERGPNSVLDTSPALRRLIDEVGLSESVVNPGEAARNRYIVRGGRLQALPTSPLSFLSNRLFSPRAKIRLLAEPFIKPSPEDDDESLAQFTRRRLGEEFLDYAVDPFVAGVFAGRADMLSVRSAFPKLHALEQEHGSLLRGAVRKRRASSEKKQAPRVQTGPGGKLLSFAGGMQELVDALARERGNALLLDQRVARIDRSDGGGYELTSQSPQGIERHTAKHLLLTIPAHSFEDVHFGFDFPIVDVLSRIEYPPVTSVFFGYRKAELDRPLDGFGMLTPSVEGRRILGTIWNSSLFKGRTPQLDRPPKAEGHPEGVAEGAAMTTFVGGSRQPEIALWPDDRLIEVVYQELRSLIGLHHFPDEVIIQRWPLAIPQYRRGHRSLMAQIDEFEQRYRDLSVSGNFRKGISVANCVEEAESLSARIAASMLSDTHQPGDRKPAA